MPVDWHNWHIVLYCTADDDYFSSCGRHCIFMKTKETLSRCMYLSYRDKRDAVFQYNPPEDCEEVD